MKASRTLLPLLLLASACAGGAPRSTAAAEAASEARAADLFARHCALCHGSDGRGDGFATPHLFPPPRDFGRGQFRLVSTTNLVPTDDDLVGVLRRGMPGSAMPSFAWLPESELRGLARYVRALAEDGLAADLAAEAAAEADPHGVRSARADAQRRMQPGAELELPPPTELAASDLARGKELYAQNCAPCHAEDGRGSDLAPHWTDDGTFVWARDFTAGVLKGGGSREAIARRVSLGLPGTSMPGFTPASPRDLDALVAHVQSLVADGAEDRLVQSRASLYAARVDDGFPKASDDAAWRAAGEVGVSLAPMIWGSDAILNARLSALHDGETLALRIAWSDPKNDLPADDDEPGIDGVAVALSAESAPPVFGMGSRAHPVDLWHWRADRMVNQTGLLDLLESPPQVRHDPFFEPSKLDVRPLYLPAVGPDAPTDEVRSIRAQGAETLQGAHSTPLEVLANARWGDGTWRVVLTRPFDSRYENAVDLAPGAELQLALAIWNASAPGSLAQKSVTIWHQLVLAP